MHRIIPLLNHKYEIAFNVYKIPILLLEISLKDLDLIYKTTGLSYSLEKNYIYIKK